MSTSIHEGPIAIKDGIHGDDDDPVSALWARDVVHNNLHHAADMAAQVRVNAVAPQSFELAASEDGYSGKWIQMRGSPFGLWYASLRKEAYRFRVRIAFGGSPDGVFIRLVIAPPNAGRIYVPGSSSLGVGELFCTVDNDGNGSSVGWHGGSQNSSTITIPRNYIITWLRSQNFADGYSGADLASKNVVPLSAHVFLKHFNDQLEAPDSEYGFGVTAVYVAEYVGP